MTTPHEFLNSAVTFLIPLDPFKNGEGRLAVANLAGLDEPLQAQLRFDADTIVFLTMTISTLMGYGALDDGRDAVEAFLGATRLWLGPDGQNRLQQLLPDWQGLRTQVGCRTNGILSSPQHAQLLIEALENPKYEWRTIESVEKETGLPTEVVRQVLSEFPGDIVQSKIPNQNGQELFTTRRHRVLKELENPRFDWRTVKGVAKTIGLSRGVVARIIAEAGDQIIQRPTPDAHGHKLYKLR